MRAIKADTPVSLTSNGESELYGLITHLDNQESLTQDSAVKGGLEEKEDGASACSLSGSFKFCKNCSASKEHSKDTRQRSIQVVKVLQECITFFEGLVKEQNSRHFLQHNRESHNIHTFIINLYHLSLGREIVLTRVFFLF